MALRKTNPDKWNNPKYRRLEPRLKCAEYYLRENCDIAGVWYVDFEHLSLYVGATVTAEEFKAAFPDMITELEEGLKWIINDYIEVECGKLSPNSHWHAKVIKVLESHGLDPEPYLNDKFKSDPIDTPPDRVVDTLPDTLSDSVSQGVSDTPKRKRKSKSKSKRVSTEGDCKGENSSKARPATQQEVVDYLRQKGTPDPEYWGAKWWNHYSSNGWKVGKNPMKSWKHAVGTWDMHPLPKIEAGLNGSKAPPLGPPWKNGKAEDDLKTVLEQFES